MFLAVPREGRGGLRTPETRKAGSGGSWAAPRATVKRKSCWRGARSPGESSVLPPTVAQGLLPRQPREHPHLVSGRRGTCRIPPPYQRDGAHQLLCGNCYINTSGAAKVSGRKRSFSLLPEVCLKRGQITPPSGLYWFTWHAESFLLQDVFDANSL